MKRFSLVFSIIIPVFALVALLNIFTPPVHAVEVSGVITSDTTWTVANSPYVVTDSLDIQAGVTLTIEAGVEVHAENNASLDVNGHLVIGDEGLAITSIISGFSTIYFQANGTGDINHAEIHGIGYEAIGISQESESPVSIKDSVIRSIEHPIWTQANNLHRLQMDNVSFASDTKNRVAVYVSGLNDGSLSKDVILTPQPGLEGYEVRGDHTLYVPAGITLTVEAGAALMSEEDPKYIDIDGHLVMSGSITSASVITGFTTIYIPANGTSDINHAEINGIGYEAVVISQESDNPVAIKNSVIRSIEHPISTQANNLHRLQMDNVSFASDTKNRVSIYVSGINNGSLGKDVILTPQPGLEGYEVRGDHTLYIPAGITLTVEAGATLMSEETSKYLDVDGHLVMSGTITSTSVISGFTAIYFPVNGTSDINHAEINGIGYEAIVISQESDNPVAIKDSVIRSIEHPISTQASNVHRLQMDNVSFASDTKNRVAIYGSGIDSSSLSKDVTLTPQPGLEGYEVRGDNTLIVPAGITLTVEAGATLMNEEYSKYVDVSGHLVTTGTITSPATISGFSAVYFSASGTGDINHAEINGAYGDAINITQESDNPVSIKDSVIRNSEYPIRVQASNWHRLQMDNVTFDANMKNRVAVYVPDLNNSSLSKDVTLTPQPGLEGYEVWGDYDLNVPAGITLTMESGTSLMGDGNGQMVEVNGRFLANGTQLNPINITSSTDSAPGEWGGISVNGGEVILNHTNLRNGEINLALTSPTSTVTISNSTVISASQSGISVTEGLLNMECSVLSENGSAGLWVDSSGTPNVTINRSDIWGNGTGITNTNSTFIDARYNWWGASDGPGGDFSGSGDSAFGNILHSPWLNTPNDCEQPPFRLFLPMILAPDD